MNNSTRFLSLFYPPHPLFLSRCLYIGRTTNLRRIHRLAPVHSSVGPISGCPLRLDVCLPPLTPKFPIGRFCTHRVRVSASDVIPSYQNQLPEWTELLQYLSEAGYFSDSRLNSSSEREFFPGFPDELLRPALACLALARDRPELLVILSRSDVEVVVDNAKPFLFRTGPDSLKKMGVYIRSGRQGTGKILDMEKASTVDLMRLLLSYVVDFASSEGSKHHDQKIMESSVRSLLSEISKMSFRAPESNVHGNMQNQFSDRNGQALGSFQKNIEMKRGDWICLRCSGLNFARNVKCFQCDEARPKRQLTGTEWECPQCDFYNYGRNVACLRCDCKRPRDFLFNSANSGYSNDHEFERRQGGSDVNSVDTDEDLSEIMPLRKGVNRFVVSTRKTPLERRLANAENTVPTDGNLNGNDNKGLGTKTNRSLNEILVSSSSLPSRSFESSQVINSNFVPFVPFPPDYFAKEKHREERTDTIPAPATEPREPLRNNPETVVGKVRNEKSLEGSLVKEPDLLDMSEEAKAERWFKRVAEIKNISELSQIPDEDFPSIMPMRKGVNRFVVSKRKTPLERRLASQRHRTNSDPTK